MEKRRTLMREVYGHACTVGASRKRRKRGSGGREDGRRATLEEPTEVGEALLLLLLPLPRLVVLKPVEDVLPLDVTVLPQLSGYVLYLVRAGGPDSLLVEAFQYGYLLLGRVPPRARRGGGRRRPLASLHSTGTATVETQRERGGGLLCMHERRGREEEREMVCGACRLAGSKNVKGLTCVWFWAQEKL
ncbi:hypothetical protein BHE74_00014509 [Ensete ventricosum]|nr:hypothetical protein BHE74_00014509 [Ensete ventricosum]RZR78914.1 hypothetical protein BHM03_00004465 [Ensete ventricosum]